MGAEGDPMDRFGDRWARATNEELPSFDLARGRERLLAANERLSRERVRRSRRAWTWIAAAAVAGAFAVGFFVRSRAEGSFTLDGKQAAVGVQVEANGTAERRILFTGGSSMTALPDSLLEVSEVDRKGAIVVLQRGGVNVDIVPHADSRWEVHAGPFNVHVLGTAFRVEWAPERQHFILTVQRGTVLVSGPMLEQGREVHAGARCDVEWQKGRLVLEPIDHDRAVEADEKPHEVEPSAPAVEAPSIDAPSAREPPSSEVRSKKGATAAAGEPHRSSSWQELERAGQFEKALREAQRVGVDGIYESATAEDLLSLARAARFVGRADVSAGALLACRKRFPATREAAAAAYLMGRNAPAGQAVKWFSAYLSEEPNGSWAREASGRLIEAYRASGDTRAAREAAKRYLGRYPGGPHADFARKVLED